jgi:hypothetical protein
MQLYTQWFVLAIYFLIERYPDPYVFTVLPDLLPAPVMIARI